MQSGMPRHIAFLIDGNRRWAEKRRKLPMLGHRQGVETVKQITRACMNRGVPYVTFWALSTENMKERSEKELQYLFGLLEKSEKFLKDFLHSARVRYIGDIKGLPKACRDVLSRIEKKTRENTGINSTLALNYGGRDELIRAMKKMMKSSNSISEKNFGAYLDTVGIPDPDLIIRTGGRNRLSGFMPWQSVYSELYFTDTLWPDFSEQELSKAIAWFGTIQRNFGK